MCGMPESHPVTVRSIERNATMNARKLLGLFALILVGAAIEAGAQTLTVKNTYANRDVWITTYEFGFTAKIQAFCVPMGQTVSMGHPLYVHGLRVRAEVLTRGNAACAQPVLCDTDMGVDKPAQGNRLSTVYVHESGPTNCYLSYTEQKDQFKAIVANDTAGHAVWITMYDYLHQPAAQRNIIESRCVLAAQMETFHHNYYRGGNYIIRAEVMTGKNGKGRDCGGRKVCDTDANPGRQVGNDDNNPKMSVIHYSGNCWIDWQGAMVAAPRPPSRP
jgi:hypothetical protein